MGIPDSGKINLSLRNEITGDLFTFEFAPTETNEELPLSYSEGAVAGSTPISQFTALGARIVSFQAFLNDQGSRVRFSGGFKTVAEAMRILKSYRQPVRTGSFIGSPPVLRLIYAEDLNGLYLLESLSFRIEQRNAFAVPIRARATITLKEFVRSPV